MLAWCDRQFGMGLGPWRFWRNVVLLSLAGLLPALWIFVARTPGFASHLAQADGALAPFLRQVLTTGLPVVVAVNAVGMALFARLRAGVLGPRAALGLDVIGRVGLFSALQGALFAGSAVAFGAFGGDPAQGLAALGPTLVRGAGFGNLAGVYFHATVLSALPLHLALVTIATGSPPRWESLVAALGMFGLQALALAGVGVALTRMG